MTTIKERALALNLAEKLCVRPQGTVSNAECFGIHSGWLVAPRQGGTVHLSLYRPSVRSKQQTGPVVFALERSHLPPEVQCDREASSSAPEKPQRMFPGVRGCGCGGATP